MEQTQVESTQAEIKQYPYEEDDIKFEEEIREAIKKLPLEQRLQLIALNSFLLSKKQDDDEAGVKIGEINDKYTNLQTPHQTAINQLIAGEKAPTQEEIADYKDQLTAEETEKIAENLTAEAIPDYWFKVLTSCVRFENDIFETDHALLKKITKIEVIPEKGDNNDFTIVFSFAPNDYFENNSISAKFFLVEDDVAEKIEATEIQWKEGKNITQKSITKRKKNKKTGKHQNITKLVDADSFFNIFKTVEVPESADDEGEEGNEMLQKIQERLDMAASIREEIALYHLEYYLGLRRGDEDGGLMGSGGAFANYDDDDFDEEDIPKIGGKKKGGK